MPRPLKAQDFAAQNAECEAAINALEADVQRFRLEWTNLARRFGFEGYDFDAAMVKLKQGESSLNVVLNDVGARLEKFLKDNK